MVPTWTLVLTFVAGLVVGGGAYRLVFGRPAPARPAAVAEPEPAVAPEPAVGPEPAAIPAERAEPAPEPAAAAAAVEPAESAVEPAQSAEAEVADTGVAEAETAEPVPTLPAGDDVVAELERRYQGRRADGDEDRSAPRRGGQR